MQGGDRGLQLIRARCSKVQRPVQQSEGFGDRGAVPAGAVLLLQQHHLAGAVVAGGGAGVVEKKQRDHPERFRFVGHQGGVEFRQPDRLIAQDVVLGLVTRGGVALGEDQAQPLVPHGEQAVLAEVRHRRHRLRSAGLADLRELLPAALGSPEPVDRAVAPVLSSQATGLSGTISHLRRASVQASSANSQSPRTRISAASIRARCSR
jgi:hypothetical protein